MKTEISLTNRYHCEIHQNPFWWQGECCKPQRPLIRLKFGNHALKDFVFPGGINPVTNLSYYELWKLGEGVHTIPLE